MSVDLNWSCPYIDNVKFEEERRSLTPYSALPWHDCGALHHSHVPARASGERAPLESNIAKLQSSA
jgi:hypothetical protein